MPENQRVDTYLSRISHISQFTLVVFAIFGYFYTVRPIYQKELLSEDIAVKQVELNSLALRLSKSEGLLKQHADKENALLANISALDESLSAARLELSKIQVQVTESKKELNRQMGLTSKIKKENRKNLADVYFENVSGVASSYFINRLYQDFDLKNIELENISELERYLGSPYEAIGAALNDKGFNFIDANKNVSASLKIEINEYLRVNLTKDKSKLQLDTRYLSLILKNYNDEKETNKKIEDGNHIERDYLLDKKFRMEISSLSSKNIQTTMDYIKSLKVKFK